MTDRTFVKVKVKYIHASQVLPPRTHTSDIAASVKSCGLQQPLIVNPIKNHPGEYTCIDGDGRREALDPEEEVLVDVRPDLSDVEIFKISEATSKRTQRTAYENAVFYADYVEAMKNAKGKKGAIAAVAADTLMSESQLSQYLAIDELFLKLQEKRPETKFDNLKTLGLNRLYELSKFRDDQRFEEIALEVEKKVNNLTAEGIKQLAETATHPPSAQETVAGDTPIYSASSVSSPEPVERENADFKTYAAMPNRLTNLIEELNALLPQTNLQELCQTNTGSPEAMNALQKMTVSLRRFIFYLKKLKKTTKTLHNSSQMLNQRKT